MNELDKLIIEVKSCTEKLQKFYEKLQSGECNNHVGKITCDGCRYEYQPKDDLPCSYCIRLNEDCYEE